ncbi:MAG: nucleoid occlusion factor SlmA [Georgfuchsia sp.]
MTAKPGERKLQILQTIATMLENPAGEKVTTALLAAKLDVSEAALYRHFASKAQMYEGLIEFIENGIFSVLNQISVDEESGLRQVELIVATALRFAQKNRGLTRVLVGDALVHESPRLQVRINQVTDRIEASLKQSLRIAVTQGKLQAGHDVGVHASVLVNYVIGRWHRFVKSGFKLDPMDQWEQHWLLLKQ